jgi:hypothetical protein
MKAQAFQGLLNLIKKNPGVAADAGISAALTTGMGLLSGDPGAALKYGAADFLFSYPATLAVRGLRPKQLVRTKNLATGAIKTEMPRSALELPVNIGASVLSGAAVSALDKPYMPPQDQVLQQQQILQQNLQRDLINKRDIGLLAGGSPNSYFPGTMLQAQGMENIYLRDALQDALNPQQINLAGIGRQMGEIVGV